MRIGFDPRFPAARRLRFDELESGIDWKCSIGL